MSTDKSTTTSSPVPAPGPAAGIPVKDPGRARPAGAAATRRRDLLVVVAGMVALPWLVWGSAIAQAHGFLSWRVPQGLALWVLAPSVAVVALVLGGRAGLRDLGRRLTRWRAPLEVYAVAVLAPLAIGALTVAVAAALGRPSHLGETAGLGSALGYFGYAIGLFLLTEEAGWTGLLLPRLQERLRPFAAAVVLGVVWGLWHLPLLHTPGERDAGLPFAAFLLLVVPVCVLKCALANAAQGSVLVAAVFHAAFNATSTYVGVVGPDHTLIWVAAAMSLPVAGSVTLLARRWTARSGAGAPVTSSGEHLPATGAA